MQNLENKVPQNYNYIQWVTVFSAFLLTLQLGLYIGWTSPNFAWLISEKSPVQATASDLSWIITLSSIASSVGAIFGAISMEYLGTRRTLLVTYLFISINWMCLLVADSVEWFYLARTIASFPSVIIASCSCMYLGEISSPDIRGTLISLALIGSPIGTVLGTIAETYLPKKLSNLIYLTFALIGIILMLWLKDTPYYFFKKRDFKNAMQSIEFYHAKKDVAKEFEETKAFVEKNESHNIKNTIREFRSPVIRRSMFGIFIMFGLSVLSGYGILLSYLEIIVKSGKFDLIKPEELVIYAIFIKIVVAFVIIRLVDKVGRKILLPISGIGTSIAMFILGLHFYLLSTGIDGNLLQWLPVVSIIMYLIMYSIGYMTVPGIVLSEIFPEQLKSTAVFLSSISAPLISIGISKAYQPIIDFAGEQYAFWCFSLLSLLGIPCAFFLMIETKGKSFIEIQNELIKKWQN